MKVRNLIEMSSDTQKILIIRNCSNLFDDQVQQLKNHAFGKELKRMEVSTIEAKGNVLQIFIKTDEFED